MTRIKGLFKLHFTQRGLVDMRKWFLLPGVAVVGGLVGFFLRRWELTSAFEVESGLPIPNAPAFWAVFVFSVLMAAVLFFACRGSRASSLGEYDRAFAAKGNKVYMTGITLSAFLFLAAGVFSLFSLPEDYQSGLAMTAMSSNPSQVSALLSVVPKALLGVLILASFVSVLFLGRNSYRAERKAKYSASALAPGYTCAFWLISAYQNRTGDPIRQTYIYELFAIIAALLAVYFIASFAFGRGRVSRAAFFSCFAIYFCITTLADRHRFAYVLLYGALLVYLVAQTALLLYNNGLGVRTVSSPDTAKQKEETEEDTYEA